ncbi:MAG: immunoglobulin-like domain-containing protein [Oscillospiraceae bacterium]
MGCACGLLRAGDRRGGICRADVPRRLVRAGDGICSDGGYRGAGSACGRGNGNDAGGLGGARRGHAGSSPAEPAEQKTRTLPGADCFAVVSESVTRTSADFTLTNEDGAVLALRSEYWLETQADSEWKVLTSNLFKAQNQTDEAAPESSVCTLHYDWQTLYGELDAGKYRLAQPVILPDGTEYTLYAEFTIE